MGKLRDAMIEGIKNGSVTIEVVTKCSWCDKTFKTDDEFEAHLVDGKTVDEFTGKPRRICPD
jgi:hypothetical protein